VYVCLRVSRSVCVCVCVCVCVLVCVRESLCVFDQRDLLRKYEQDVCVCVDMCVWEGGWVGGWLNGCVYVSVCV